MNKKVEELAKELFIKSPNSGIYLTDQTRQNTVSTIKNSIEVAKLFYQILEENKNE